MTSRRNYDDRPIGRKKAFPVWALVLLIAVPVVVCGGGSVVTIIVMSAVSKSASNLQKQRAESAIKMPVGELITEWKRNPVAAAEKYQETAVEIDGVIADISSNISGQTYLNINVDDKKSGGTHIFALSDDVKRELVGFKIGDRVKVVATATGDSQDIPWLVAHSIRR